MSRSASTTMPELSLNDDEPYLAVLVSAKVVPSKNKDWAPQLEVDWELRQGGKLRDWLGLGLTMPNKAPTKLRQLLNAIAEQPKDEELWWDADTLEWGYGDAATSAPYAKLTSGMVVQFRGETAPGKRYRINSYRKAPK